MLRGKLTNIAQRQQLLGITFIVRVQNRADGRSALVHVDGEPLPAGKSTVIARPWALNGPMTGESFPVSFRFA